MIRREDPVVPGPLYGLRAWTVDNSGRLGALFKHGWWRRGARPTKARCAAGQGHPAPAARCGCGLYALHPTPQQCREIFDASRSANEGPMVRAEVWGLVAAWGQVELHKTGFRAEYARPHAFVLPAAHRGSRYAQWVKELAAAHDAELWEVDSAAQLHQRCVERNLGLSPAAVKGLLGRQLSRHALAERLRHRLGQACDLAGALAGAAIGSIIPLFFVASIAFELLGDGGEDPRPAGTKPQPLKVLEQRFFEYDDGDLYVALVRNESRSKTALQVRPKGAFLDETGYAVAVPDGPAGVDNRPSLAPGQVGVVYDWFSYGESVADQVKRIQVRMVAGRWVEGPARSPVDVSRVWLDRRDCLLRGTLRSSRRRLQAGLAGVIRDRRGRIVDSEPWVAGPLRRGRSRQILARIQPYACLRERLQFEAYPNLPARELTARRTQAGA